jgi:hypothetical protein
MLIRTLSNAEHKIASDLALHAAVSVVCCAPWIHVSPHSIRPEGKYQRANAWTHSLSATIIPQLDGILICQRQLS